MSRLGNWITILSVTTIGIGCTYLTGQQILRQSANDPQVQIAEDTANQLVKGTAADGVTTRLSVDLQQSLAPFIIIYDAQGNVQASQAVLDGNTPVLPNGVLDYTKRYGQHSLTWQPKPGIREAVVIQYFVGPNNTSGYVLAGRSLREIEKRENALLFIAVYAWIAIFLASGAGMLLFGKSRSKR